MAWCQGLLRPPALRLRRLGTTGGGSSVSISGWGPAAAAVTPGWTTATPATPRLSHGSRTALAAGSTSNTAGYSGPRVPRRWRSKYRSPFEQQHRGPGGSGKRGQGEDEDEDSDLEKPAPNPQPSRGRPKTAEPEKLPELRQVVKQLFRRVHPDLFEAHPAEQAQNQTSFVQMNSFLDGLDKDQLRTGHTPQTWSFVFHLRENQGMRRVDANFTVPAGARGSVGNPELMHTVKRQLLKLFKAAGVSTGTASGGKEDFSWGPAVEERIAQSMREAMQAPPGGGPLPGGPGGPENDMDPMTGAFRWQWYSNPEEAASQGSLRAYLMHIREEAMQAAEPPRGPESKLCEVAMNGYRTQGLRIVFQDEHLRLPSERLLLLREFLEVLRASPQHQELRCDIPVDITDPELLEPGTWARVVQDFWSNRRQRWEAMQAQQQEEGQLQQQPPPGPPPMAPAKPQLDHTSFGELHRFTLTDSGDLLFMSGSPTQGYQRVLAGLRGDLGCPLSPLGQDMVLVFANREMTSGVDPRGRLVLSGGPAAAQDWARCLAEPGVFPECARRNRAWMVSARLEKEAAQAFGVSSLLSAPGLQGDPGYVEWLRRLIARPQAIQAAISRRPALAKLPWRLLRSHGEVSVEPRLGLLVVPALGKQPSGEGGAKIIGGGPPDANALAEALDRLGGEALLVYGEYRRQQDRVAEAVLQTKRKLSLGGLAIDPEAREKPSPEQVLQFCTQLQRAAHVSSSLPILTEGLKVLISDTTELRPGGQVALHWDLSQFG